MLCPSSTTHNASRLDAVSSYCRGYPVGGTLAISSLCYLRNFSSHALGSEETEVTSEVQEANDRHSGDLQLKKVNEHQWGVFASRTFAKGSTVISSTLIPRTDNPSSTSCSHSIQIDWNKHILMKLPARFLNHSCDPNIGVDGGGVNGASSYDFVALRDIEAGEEVRFDYETTEYEVGAFSECHCVATNCRGVIRGYKHSSDVIQSKYGGENVAHYLMSSQSN